MRQLILEIYHLICEHGDFTFWKHCIMQLGFYQMTSHEFSPDNLSAFAILTLLLFFHLPITLIMSTKTVGDYILSEKIGRGSFAVVYKAKHKVIKSKRVHCEPVYLPAQIKGYSKHSSYQMYCTQQNT
jgi:serine/threonine protein kinase